MLIPIPPRPSPLSLYIYIYISHTHTLQSIYNLYIGCQLQSKQEEKTESQKNRRCRGATAAISKIPTIWLRIHRRQGNGLSDFGPERIITKKDAFCMYGDLPRNKRKRYLMTLSREQTVFLSDIFVHLGFRATVKGKRSVHFFSASS